MEEYNCDNLNLQSITNVNRIISCVEDVKELHSESASLSLFYLLEFMDNTRYYNDEIKFGFQKVFLSKMNDTYLKSEVYFKDHAFDFTSSQSLLYEYFIYKYKITPIIDLKISPNFVKFLGGIVSTEIDNLSKFLKDHQKDYQEEKLVQKISENIVQQFELKVGEEFTPIDDFSQDEVNAFINHFKRQLTKFKIGFILNEALQQPKMFNEIYSDRDIGESIQLKKIGDLSPIETWNILFQILQGCYTMFLSGIVHNDLHGNNIFVKKIEPTKMTYKINDQDYIITTSNLVLIYDFDHAYIKNYDNPYLADDGLKEYNQVNEYRQGKDFIKIVSHILSTKILSFNDIKDIVLIKDIEKNKESFEVWKKRIEDKDLQYKNENDDKDYIEDEEWTYINTYPVMIDRLYKKIVEIKESNRLKDDYKVELKFNLNEDMFDENNNLNIPKNNKYNEEWFKEYYDLMEQHPMFVIDI
jgi:hypothetical protein